MRRLFLLFLILISVRQVRAQAVLVEEVPPEKTGARGQVTEQTRQGSYLRESRSLRDVFKGGEYLSVEAMRSDRRVGVGVETFGRLGAIGLNVELNYGPSDSATAGIGGGPGYSSVSLGGKHVFGGARFSPYATLSFTRWSAGSGGRLDGTTPAYLEGRFLTDQEKESGRFAKNFLVPGIGAQFNQLEGPSAGAALFAEVIFMVEASTMDYVPTGALGALYFF